MVSRKTAGADKHHNMSAAVTGGGSAFNQVPSINASSYDKESSHMMGINTVQTSSQSSGVFKYPPGADVTTVPNYTVHTGRANNHNDKSNSNSHSRNPSPSEKQTLLHVRQNFGKDHGYLPPIPTTKNSRSSSKQQHHHMTMEEVRGGVANEMPFDFLNHTVVRDRSFDGPGSNKKLPSVNSMDGVVGSNGAGRDDIFCGGIVDELDPDQGRFTIPPLRVSNPSAFQNEETYNVRKSHHETNNRKQQNNSAPTLTADCEEPRSSATPILNNIAAQGSGSVSRKKPPHDNGDDSVFDFVEDVSLLQNPSNNNKATVKVTHKMRRRKDRTRASPSLKVQQQLGAPHHLDDEDETVGDNTSLEDDAVHPAIKRPSPATLQERAAEAWKVRRAARTSSLRAKDKPGGANKSSNVSFVESDTVHHFEPTVESLSENDTANYVDEDETTLDMDGRSLNSEYTKTLESEVEDMIKDILFIGNGKSSIPGRRKLRDKPEIKRRLRQKKHMMMQDMGSTRDTTTQDSEISNSNPSGIGMVPQEATDYDDTQDDSLRGSSTNTFTDPSRSIPRTRGLDDEGNTTGTNSTAVRPVQDGSDPFLAIWGLVEGGVAAVSYALGLDDEPTDGEKKKNQKGGSSRHCIPQLAMHQTPRSGVQQGSGDFSDVLFGEGTCAGAIAQGPYGQYTSSKPEVHQDLHWYNEIEGGSESSNENFSSNSKSQDDAVQGNGFPFDPESMDQDPRLIHLALQAAKSLHQLKGLQYDESIPVNMISDVKMSIVELKLPLGLIFLENDGGCFVTKVAPDGSAARSGGVEIGDQLACVNGVVSLGMRVGDICKIIPRSSHQKIVELGLLRYVGRLRPVNKKSTWDNYDVLEAKEHLKSNFEGQEMVARQPKKPEKGAKGKMKFRFFRKGKKRN